VKNHPTTREFGKHALVADERAWLDGKIGPSKIERKTQVEGNEKGECSEASQKTGLAKGAHHFGECEMVQPKKRKGLSKKRKTAHKRRGRKTLTSHSTRRTLLRDFTRVLRGSRRGEEIWNKSAQGRGTGGELESVVVGETPSKGGISGKTRLGRKVKKDVIDEKETKVSQSLPLCRRSGRPKKGLRTPRSTASQAKFREDLPNFP